MFLDNGKAKLLWDFNVYTDHVIEMRRPDVGVGEKDTRECLIINIAGPGDMRVSRKEEKIEKYSEHCIELSRAWEVKCM